MKIALQIPISIPNWDETSRSPPPPSHRDEISRIAILWEDSLEDWRGELGSHLHEEALAEGDRAAARCCDASLRPRPLLGAVMLPSFVSLGFFFLIEKNPYVP
jgi:hypothetical protein